MSGPVIGFQANLPPIQSPLLQTKQDGTPVSPPIMSTPWYRILQALFERTGGGDGTPLYLAGSFDSAGATQATATKLVTTLSFITKVGGGVMLPVLQGGEFAIVVLVTPSTDLNVYPPLVPPGNGQINLLGAGNPYVMNPGGAIAFPTVQIFWVETPTQYYATKLG